MPCSSVFRMEFKDSRSFKAVVLADYFVNSLSYPGLPDSSPVYDAVRDSDYGIIKMPPLGIPESSADQWVTITADQIQEYSNRGFKILLLGMKPLRGSGVWLPKLTAELRSRKVKRPPTMVMTASQMRRGAPEAVKRFLAA